jgi:hypothetical protein
MSTKVKVLPTAGRALEEQDILTPKQMRGITGSKEWIEGNAREKAQARRRELLAAGKDPAKGKTAAEEGASRTGTVVDDFYGSKSLACPCCRVVRVYSARVHFELIDLYFRFHFSS